MAFQIINVLIFQVQKVMAEVDPTLRSYLHTKIAELHTLSIRAHQAHKKRSERIFIEYYSADAPVRVRARKERLSDFCEHCFEPLVLSPELRRGPSGRYKPAMKRIITYMIDDTDLCTCS